MNDIKELIANLTKEEKFQLMEYLKFVVNEEIENPEEDVCECYKCNSHQIVKLGIYDINNSYTLSDIENGKYKLFDIKDIYPQTKKIIITDEHLLKKIKNGMVLDKFYEGKDKMILDKDENLIAIYTECDDKNKVKPWKMF